MLETAINKYDIYRISQALQVKEQSHLENPEVSRLLVSATEIRPDKLTSLLNAFLFLLQLRFNFLIRDGAESVTAFTPDSPQTY